MDWNSKTSSEWDWENLAMFGGKAVKIPQRVQLSIHEIEGDGVDSVSIYSSGDAGFSGSDMGYGSSSKSSISASTESSLKEGMKMKTFHTVDCLPKDLIDKEQFSSVANNENFHAPAIGSGEPVVGLKLGKRTYFEDMGVASNTKTTSVPVISKPFAATTKRSRATYQSTQTPRCQVEGCNLDLKSAKEYHRRHRICENHSKSPKVIVAGMERRFCQQCSRFHDLSEFDDKKRSCRRRLSDHNARRRRPQPEATQFNSSRLSSSLYDGRQHLLMNSNPTWPSACSFKVTHVRDSFISPAKSGGFDRQPHLSSEEMLNAISLLHLEPDRVLSLQSTTPSVLNHGSEASAITSTTLNVAPDLRRVLSLLSTNSWASNGPEPNSMEPLMHVNQTTVAHPVLTSSEYVQVEQPPSESRMHSLDLHYNGSSHFQEFQLCKAHYDSRCFYSNQIN